MVDTHTVIWNLLADNNSVDEIYDALQGISEDDIEEVQKEYYEVEKD